MKYIVIVGDGMADYPLEELGNRTPLQVANKPNIDAMARRGRCGLLQTIPQGMGAGSDIANLTILGYDPRRYYTGRGPLEAASMGVKLGSRDIAFRCNLITEKDGRIIDYSAGHITSSEAKELIHAAKKAFANVGEFYAGVSYRHLFVLRNSSSELESVPPHDVMGGKIEDYLIKPTENGTAKKLNKMMLDSKRVLSQHPVNLKRVKEGKNPGNMLWLWGNGRAPQLEPLYKKYGLRGAVISAVDLIRGIGTYLGMEIIKVPGATGYYDTNYEGKAEAALKALERRDYVYVHVEAPDEAGHAGSVEDKIKSIENLDRRLVGKILNAADDNLTLAVLPDHPTPIKVKTHTSDPVPFAIYSHAAPKDGIEGFNEEAAKRGSLGSLEGEQFMKTLLGRK